jgi:hypothetical protein
MNFNGAFDRMRNETLPTPGVFVFELGWDQVLVGRERFRVSGLFFNVAVVGAIHTRTS